jgi:hypothetical protein
LSQKLSYQLLSGEYICNELDAYETNNHNLNEDNSGYVYGGYCVFGGIRTGSERFTAGVNIDSVIEELT